MTTHPDGSVTLTRAEWVCVASLAESCGVRNDDVMGELTKIGAFWLLQDDYNPRDNRDWSTGIVELSKHIEAGAKDFEKYRQEKIDADTFRRRLERIQ